MLIWPSFDWPRGGGIRIVPAVGDCQNGFHRRTRGCCRTGACLLRAWHRREEIWEQDNAIGFVQVKGQEASKHLPHRANCLLPSHASCTLHTCALNLSLAVVAISLVLREKSRKNLPARKCLLVLRLTPQKKMQGRKIVCRSSDLIEPLDHEYLGFLHLNSELFHTIHSHLRSIIS